MKKEIKMTFGKGRDASIEDMDYLRFSGEEWLTKYANKTKNSFNEIYQSQMEELKSKYIKIRDEYQSLDKYDSDDHFNFAVHEQYFEDQLFALSEMNIIYIFKESEINLNLLLKNVYGNDDKDLYKWLKLKNFFKSKKISISGIDGFNELNELRILNNHLKHSNREISGEIKSILEFKEEKYLTVEMINKFFKRIKSYPHIFLQNIVSVIHNDLYKFDEVKIKQMAKEIPKRMGKEDAKLYCDEILKLY